MKKIFLAFAMLAAMTACVQDELNPDALVPPQEEQQPDQPSDQPEDTPTDQPGETPAPEVEPTIVLNELFGGGEDKDKFFELYNPGSKEVSLKGYTIKKDEELSWTGADDLKIAAKGYYVILGSKNSTPDGFSTGFSAKKSVIVELFDADGNKIDTFQRGEKGDGWGVEDPEIYVNNKNGSWSRVPDGSGKFMITPTVTAGAANDGTDATEDPSLVGNGVEPAPEPTIVLNELFGGGEDKDKFFELYNPGSKEVSLKGYTIKKDEELSWTGADDLKIAAKGYYVILGSKNSTPDGFSTGFSAKKSVIVELFDADGNKIDTFQRGEKGDGWGVEDPEIYVNNKNGSWSRVPDGSGKFMITPTVTAGAANDGTDATEDASVKQ